MAFIQPQPSNDNIIAHITNERNKIFILLRSLGPKRIRPKCGPTEPLRWPLATALPGAAAGACSLATKYRFCFVLSAASPFLCACVSILHYAPRFLNWFSKTLRQPVAALRLRYLFQVAYQPAHKSALQFLFMLVVSLLPLPTNALLRIFSLSALHYCFGMLKLFCKY